jgi:hypothetical protein
MGRRAFRSEILEHGAENGSTCQTATSPQPGWFPSRLAAEASCARQQRTVRFCKIDVEGGEFQVLKGAMETVRRDRPFIVFEFGMGGADWYGVQPEDMYRLLASCGLELSLISDWLASRPCLGEREFAAKFREFRNYYFLAHPRS